jgi:hypothetical protein
MKQGYDIRERSGIQRDYNATATIIKMKDEHHSLLHRSIQAARLYHMGLQQAPSFRRGDLCLVRSK